MKLSFGFLIAVLLCLHGVVRADQSPTERSLSIGAVLSLTGIASVHGLAIRDGLEFARSKLESQGWKIDISYQDDGTEPKRTISAVQQLAATGIRFFVGPTWGILAVPAAPVFKRSSALSLQPCNSSDFVEGTNDRYFFFFSPPSTSQQLIDQFLKEQSGKKVGLVIAISAWGDLWQKLFENGAKQAGLQIVSTDLVQYGEIDAAMPTLVAKLKQRGVDVVLSTSSKDSTALMVAAFEKQHLPVTILSPDLFDSVADSLISPKSKFVDGYTVTPKSSDWFRREFKEWKGENPHKYSDSGYDTLIALAEAVQHVGNDVEAVKEYFEKTIDLEGAAGRVKFDSHHDVAGSGYEITQMIFADPTP